MKKPDPAASLFSALLFLTAFLPAGTTQAAKNAPVDLGGAGIGAGSDVTRTSTAGLDAYSSYYFKLTGTCHGTDGLAALLPPGTPVGEMLDLIQPGSQALISGGIPNPGSTLAGIPDLNRTFAGTVMVGDASVPMSISLTAGVDNVSGIVSVRWHDVSFDHPGMAGAQIIFEAGASFATGVSPTYDPKIGTVKVSESGGSVDMIFRRLYNTEIVNEVTVVTVDGSATAPEHYTTVDQVLVFGVGETEKTVTVPIINSDAMPNPVRALTVELLIPPGGQGYGICNVEIQDEDFTPGVAIVEISDYFGFAFEEDDGYFSVGVVRYGDLSISTSVPFTSTSGTAIKGKHYILTNSTRSFPPNSTFSTIGITALNDFTDNPDRSFKLELGTPGPNTYLGHLASAQITLVDDDIPSSPVRTGYEFVSSTSALTEGGGSMRFGIVRTSATSAGTVRVKTSDGTAKKGVHYTEVNQLVTFDVGQLAAEVTVPVLNDLVDEAETLSFKITLSTPSFGVIGKKGSASGVIYDDDIGQFDLTGGYSGLIISASDALSSTGLGTLAFTSGGKFSGKILLGTSTYSITGKLPVSGATPPIVLNAAAKLTVELTVDMVTSPFNKRVAVVIRNNGVETAAGVLNKVMGAPETWTRPGQFNTVLKPPALTGLQTAATVPQGVSHGKISLTSLGKATLALALCDGTSITFSGNVTPAGLLPVFRPMYKAGSPPTYGAVFGNLTLAASPASDDVSGSLRWIKPPRPAERKFAGGFDVSTTADGCVYLKPAAGMRVISVLFPVGRITHGNLPAQVPFSGLLNFQNVCAISPPNDHTVGFTINVTAGTFSGKFTPPGGVPTPFTGVILQNDNAMWGAFLGKPPVPTAIEAGSIYVGAP